MSYKPKRQRVLPARGLRQRAEALLTKTRQDLADMTPSDLQRLVQELQIHQIELDLQNEELRRTQIELQDAYERYADLYDFSPAGHLYLDASGMILEANLTATQLLGVTKSRVRHCRLSDFVAATLEAQNTLHQHRLQVFAEPTSCTCNLWMQRRDGTPFYAQLKSLARRLGDTGPLYWRLALIDLTALRQQAEEELAWSAAIVTSSRDAIIGMTVEGVIVSWNAAAERLYSYTAAEVIGRSVDLLTPPERHHETLALLARMRCGEHIALYETQRLTKTGQWVDVSLSLSPIQTRDGTIIGVSKIVHDITAQKQREARLQETERALRRSQAQLRRVMKHQQHLQEQERAVMAREIHDELAQTLTVLQMDIAWLANQMTLSPDTSERLQAMATQVESLDDAMHRIAAALHPRLLDDLGLVAALEWQLEEMLRRAGLAYTLQVSPEELLLDSDRATTLFRISQEVLTNVLRHANASRVEVCVSQDAEAVCLEVRDNGRGIDPAQLKGRQSLGILGMHERARLWGGEVSLQSVPDAGTAVCVRMPHQSAAEPESPA